MKLPLLMIRNDYNEEWSLSPSSRTVYDYCKYISRGAGMMENDVRYFAQVYFLRKVCKYVPNVRSYFRKIYYIRMYLSTAHIRRVTITWLIVRHRSSGIIYKLTKQCRLLSVWSFVTCWPQLQLHSVNQFQVRFCLFSVWFTRNTGVVVYAGIPWKTRKWQIDRIIRTSLRFG